MIARWSTSRPDSLRLAHEAGERAPPLAPRSADAHYVLSFAIRVQGDIDRALEENETEVEARAALAIRQQIGSHDLTITAIKEDTRSDYPEYIRLMERYYEGLL